jgi:hypothetical protein
MASNKIKPSSKEYMRDSKGKIMNSKWYYKHHTTANTSTEELKKLYESPSYNKKKNIIKKELIKRGVL